MESSDAEMGMVDCGVGTIVWVRRRNGSWWPGKILGPVELSASHLMSPRSGTPVKLLGREDASVDWYNLEKSKRVKPFRCGEFDECIERAEASQGMPPKKREKYARREDAILHALELEKQLLEKKYGGKSKGIIETSACENGNTDMELSVAHVSNIDEKSNTDVRPRLRGLQDLGNQGGSKYSINISSSNKHGDGSKKRSQQQEGNNNNNEEKRRDRRRPLVQLLKNIPDLHLVDDMGVDDYTQPNTAAVAAAAASGSTEDTETDSSGTESLLSDTYDSMAAAALLDEGEDVEFIPKAEAAYEEEEESESEDSLQPIQKWQLKGKRNIRSRYTSFPWMKERRLLIDVEVGVQSGYQREHVPMISLMSKLNDQAIVGHPIPVETLEDSSSDYILLSASAATADDDEYLQPWRTARRTAKSRVYRPPTLDEYLVDDDYDEDEEEEEDDDDDDGNNKRNHKSKKLRTSASSCNQKIRTLSSIGGNHHHHHHHHSAAAAAAGEEDEEEEEMKPEALPTAVACIPVKLVFSRLHEELVARHQ